MTKISISGEKFLLNGKPVYEGRTFEGKQIEGLLFNVRAVQATFDDTNPQDARAVGIFRYRCVGPRAQRE